MTEKYSTGLRDFMLGEGSFRKAMDDCVLKIFSAPIPADADAAQTGTLLCTITKAGATVDPTEFSVAKQALIDITVAAHPFTVIVAINGTDYTYTSVADDDSLLKTARKVSLMLSTIPEIEANALGEANGKISIKSRIAGLTFTIAKGGGGGGGTATWAITDNTIANSRCDALQFGAPASGVIAKAVETWQGDNVAGGVAAYFRLVRPNDTGALSTTELRVQGSVGLADADLNLPSVQFVLSAPTRINNFSITLPASD